MEYILWLQGLRNETLNTILINVTEIVTSPLIYLFVSVLYWCFAKKAAVMIAMNLSVGSMINQMLKNIFCIYRPWIRNSKVKPVAAAMENATGYSFPSGHSQLAATEFLSIAVWQKKRKWLVAVCVFMTLLVMFTRNYLGVHTVPDVVASLLIACFVVAVMPKLLDWVEGGKMRDVVVSIIFLVIGGALLAYTTLKEYPLDYLPDRTLLVSPREMITDCYSAAGCLFGFFLGWVLERHFLNFTTEVSAKTKWLRGTIGAILVLAYVLLAEGPMVKLDMYWGNFAFLCLAFVLILFLYPAAFVGVEKLVKKKKSTKKETLLS